ncbi:MAG: sulfatase family protein [Solirubrobacteraceae bacterium]
MTASVRHALARAHRALRALRMTAVGPVIAGVVAAALSGAPAATARMLPEPSGGQPPNIVFVLTDDLSMDLLRYMPQVQALESRGMTFSHYFVSDSLCCPSRASIFTGLFPHDSGVFTNTSPDGGIGAFWAHGDELRSFNVTLQRAGYQTAMMGKYLNGYLQGPTRSPLPDDYVPPGWNEWDVAGYGYPEFDYRMNIDGTVRYFGHRPADYLTSVIARRGVRFIDRTAATGSPFFLELATYSPHTPFVPAPRDSHLFPGLRAPRPPSFDVLPTHPPVWLSGHRPLRPGQIRRIDEVFRLRAQDVQSVDRMISAVQRALVATGELSNTYIVFSSDNGLHTGEYRMMPGKLTAFDTDIHVPLVVAGPGVPPGSTSNAMTENVDLAETFAAMAGTTLDADGHSLLGLMHGGRPIDWRDAVLVEHRGPATSRLDPDRQSRVSGNPPSYEALRTPRFLYVEYVDGQRELYDLRRDPYELHNIAGSAPRWLLTRLHGDLAAYKACHGASCWTAGHVS